MMAIGDEGRTQPVFGKLRPEKVGMAGKRAGEAVAKVRGKSGACIGGAVDLGWGCVAVSDCDDHSFSGEGGNEFERGFAMWRDGDHADEIAAGCLPTLELGQVWGTNMFERMGSPVAVSGRDERALNVHKRNCVGHQRDWCVSPPQWHAAHE